VLKSRRTFFVIGQANRSFEILFCSVADIFGIERFVEMGASIDVSEALLAIRFGTRHLAR
jgi:uncharacterized membrane protein YraQ (UPF0718 family)